MRDRIPRLNRGNGTATDMKYREMRLPCDREVTLGTPHGTDRAMVRNVCSHGARLAGVEGLSPGDVVTLDLHLTRAEARVAWVRTGLCGLRFTAPLGVAELDRIRGRSGPAAPKDWPSFHEL